MKRALLTSLTVLGFATLMAPGLAAAAPPGMDKDGVLVDHKEMTLYTYDDDTVSENDAEIVSACVDACLKNWPPLKAPDSAKGEDLWSVFKRPDGSKQWAYNGQPLYFYVGDKKAGEQTGEGKANGKWHTAMSLGMD